MRIVSGSVLILALGLSLSSASPIAGPSIQVKKGSYAWHAWNTVYQEAYPGKEGYERFKKEVAELNPNVLHGSSDSAFRKIPRKVDGKITRIKLPALSGATVSASEIAKAKQAGRDEAKLEFKAVEDALRSERDRLAEALNRVSSAMYKNLSFWLYVVAALFFGGAIAYVLTRRYYDGRLQDDSQLAALRQEIGGLRTTVENREKEIYDVRRELMELRRESDARDHFVGKYTEVYDLPHDIGSFKGKHNRIYLLRSPEPLEGEPAVLVWNGTKYTTVKRENLNRWFDEHKNNAEVMEFYGIYPDEQVTRRMRTGTNG